MKGDDYVGIYEHALAMQRYPFIVEQADRIYPVLQLVQGSRHALTRDEVLEKVSMQVAILEADPELEYTSCDGGIMTTRAPGNHSYMIHLWAASVSTLELAMYEEKEREKNA